MLNELLVLGRVPGTSFQITFSELLLLLDAGLLFMVLERYHHFTQMVRYYWLYSRLFVAVKKIQLLSLWQNRLGV